jgi:predicted lipoprotein with Yx(FWY)xxD motif
MSKLLFPLLIAAALAPAPAALADDPRPPVRTLELRIPVVVDLDGRSIYVFDKEKEGLPVCYDECAKAWPPVPAPSGDLPPPFASVERKDGPRQLTLRGRPLYYYFKDRKVGDAFGDGLKGVWFLARP